IPGRTPDLLFYNPATGALALRVVLAEWDDRLPDRLSLAYDSQAPDPQARFKLDWDRALTVSDGGATVVVEDRWLRPIAFTDVDGTLTPPLGIHASLQPAGDGYDLNFFDQPDVTEQFRVSNGTCCLLMSKSEVYGNTIQVQRNSANKVTRITPAARPAINIG